MLTSRDFATKIALILLSTEAVVFTLFDHSFDAVKEPRKNRFLMPFLSSRRPAANPLPSLINSRTARIKWWVEISTSLSLKIWAIRFPQSQKHHQSLLSNRLFPPSPLPLAIGQACRLLDGPERSGFGYVASIGLTNHEPVEHT